MMDHPNWRNNQQLNEPVAQSKINIGLSKKLGMAVPSGFLIACKDPLNPTRSDIIDELNRRFLRNE